MIEKCNNLYILSDNKSQEEIRKNLKVQTELILSGVYIEVLTDCFAELSHLKKLSISRTKIKKLPDSFKSLINLEILDLFKNQHDDDSISIVSNLKNLSANKITVLHDEFGNLDLLEVHLLDYKSFKLC